MNSTLMALTLFLIINVIHAIYFMNHLTYPIALFKLHLILGIVHGVILILFLMFYKKLQNSIGFILVGVILVKMVVLKYFLGHLIETYEVTQPALFLIPPYMAYITLLMTIVVKRMMKMKISVKSEP